MIPDDDLTQRQDESAANFLARIVDAARAARSERERQLAAEQFSHLMAVLIQEANKECRAFTFETLDYPHVKKEYLESHGFTVAGNHESLIVRW